jgi:hypothetical protein
MEEAQPHLIPASSRYLILKLFSVLFGYSVPLNNSEHAETLHRGTKQNILSLQHSAGRVPSNNVPSHGTILSSRFWGLTAGNIGK